MGELAVARPEAVLARVVAARLQDQGRRGAWFVGGHEGLGVGQPMGPGFGVAGAARVALVGAGLQGQPGHQRAAALRQGEHTGDNWGRERGAAVEGHAVEAVAGAAAVLVEAGDHGHGHTVAGGDHVDLAVGGEAGDLAAVVGRPDRDDAGERGRVLGDSVAGVAGRGDHGLAGGEHNGDRLLLGLGPLGAAEVRLTTSIAGSAAMWSRALRR